MDAALHRDRSVILTAQLNVSTSCARNQAPSWSNRLGKSLIFIIITMKEQGAPFEVWLPW